MREGGVSKADMQCGIPRFQGRSHRIEESPLAPAHAASSGCSHAYRCEDFRCAHGRTQHRNASRPSRFRRHFNEGYPIHIVDGNLDEVKDHIFTLRCKCESDMTLRWHLHEIGLDSGRLTIGEFKKLFSWALELDNVLVTPTLMK